MDGLNLFLPRNEDSVDRLKRVIPTYKPAPYPFVPVTNAEVQIVKYLIGTLT